MCGINGFNGCDPKLIEAMNKKLERRGPDDSGTFSDDCVSLGHRRLAILDLTDAGHQPMFYSKEMGGCSEKYRKENISGSDAAIVFNGEIYNFKEIRTELEKKGYRFTTRTDTEVILAAYLEWKHECVHRFNGMWAFCIYDKEERILLCSRDRLGVKPFYYHHKNGKFIFSSEIRGVLCHQIKREVNEETAFDFLYYNITDHSNQTFFMDIKKLDPGHNLTFHIPSNQIKEQKYYDLRNRIEYIDQSTDSIRDRFIAAVKRRLVSDVTVGSCLSGGIDSSAIVCVMDSFAKDIPTFSLVFPNEPIDESKYQQIVEAKTKTIRKTTTFNEDDILKDISDLIETQEEPFCSLSMYGEYRIMKLVKENNIKVLLGGQGSDEILCGYHYFFGNYLFELITEHRIREFADVSYRYYKEYRSLLPHLRLLTYLMPRPFVEKIYRLKNSHLKAEFIRKNNNRKTLDLVINKAPVNEATLTAELRSSLSRQLRSEDKNSMRWSVETRAPFCDYELVEKIIGLPTRQKIRGTTTKYIFREAMVGILPEEIRVRKDKIGFATPDAKLLRQPAGERFAAEIIDSHSFSTRRYWKAEKAKKMLENHIKNKKDHSKELWRMIILELWLRQWIDNGK